MMSGSSFDCLCAYCGHDLSPEVNLSEAMCSEAVVTCRKCYKVNFVEAEVQEITYYVRKEEDND